MEPASIAVAVADVVLRAGDSRALRAYPERLLEAYEGYFILGRTFVKLLGNARVMGALTKHGLKRVWLMRFAFTILANLTEPRDGAASDRLINAMVRNAPAIDRMVHS